MFNFLSGTAIALIKGANKQTFLYYDVNKKDGYSFFELAQGESFQLIPSNLSKGRETLFIAGPTGCGKTKFAVEFMNLYLQIFQKRDIIIFTPDPNDTSLASITDKDRSDIVDINLKDENSGKYRIIQEDVNINDFEKCLVFFDDIAIGEDDSLIKFMDKLRHKVIGVGRHKDVSVITSRHMVTDYRNTRNDLADTKYVVCFPLGGGRRVLDHYFSKYLMLSSELKAQIFSWNADWLVFHQKFPNFVLSNNKVLMI